MGDNNGCTCGSGGHPRKCEKHPWAFSAHAADLNHDALSAEVEELETRLNAAIKRIDLLEAALKQASGPRNPPRYR